MMAHAIDISVIEQGEAAQMGTGGDGVDAKPAHGVSDHTRSRLHTDPECRDPSTHATRAGCALVVARIAEHQRGRLGASGLEQLGRIGEVVLKIRVNLQRMAKARGAGGQQSCLHGGALTAIFRAVDHLSETVRSERIHGGSSRLGAAIVDHEDLFQQRRQALDHGTNGARIVVGGHDSADAEYAHLSRSERATPRCACSKRARTSARRSLPLSSRGRRSTKR